MRTILIAAAGALMFGAPALAQQPMSSGPDTDGRQGVMDPNGPNVPPGDGITMRGNDPEGQAFVPPGYNNMLPGRVYPPLAMAPPGLIGGEYPVCSSRVTDRCVQAYTSRTRMASRRR